MEIFIPIILLLIPILIANLIVATENKSAATLFEILLAVFNVPLIAAGLLFFFIPPEINDQLAEFGFPNLNWDAAGWVLLLVGLWSVLICIRPLRKILARLIPIDPASPVHTLALVLAGYLVGNTLITLGLDILTDIAQTELDVSISDIFLQQLAFVIVAFLGSGWATRRNLTQIRERLGLERPTIEHLLWGIGTIVLLIGIQWTIGILWALAEPEQAAELTELNELLLGNVDTVGEWFVLAVATGVGEEILFRGAVQPVFGLVTTSLLFAIVHVQYGLTPITAAVFIIGLILGILRRKTNTTTVIFVHFSYNFILGLFALLATYLQDMLG